MNTGLTVFYFVKENGEKVGSVSCYKMRKMCHGRQVHSCDISEFDGELLDDEYIG